MYRNRDAYFDLFAYNMSNQIFVEYTQVFEKGSLVNWVGLLAQFFKKWVRVQSDLGQLVFERCKKLFKQLNGPA
jgi:hypothetical protein